MTGTLLEYWWVALITVPALALVIRWAALRSGVADQLAPGLRSRLEAVAGTEQGWVVTATLADGRRFRDVVIDRRFRLEGQAPFRIGDLVDLRVQDRGDPEALGPPTRVS